MKQLEKSDLKEGLIYKATNKDFYYIFKATKDLKNIMNVTGYNMFFKEGDFNGNFLQFFEVTSEEKHWLETCIKAYQFVSYEEAMKTFIPEYVECVSLTYPNMKNINFGEIGKIYKVLNYNHSISDMIIKGCLLSVGKERFKPSTKEAYDAQFVVKEPKFVLPEIWWVRITKENLEDVCKFLGFKPYEKAVDYVAGMCKHYRTGKIEKSWNSEPTTIYGSTFGDEITTEQFRKYVLKKEPVVFEEPKDTVLRFQQINKRNNIDICITEVQCSEGGIYKIGDKITVFTHDSPNKGKVFTIKSFRWNNAKTNLCAITELHTPNGIGLDKIELYVEPKVKITHNFKIGDKISIVYDTIAGSSVFIIENIEGNRLIINNETGTLHNTHKSVLAKNAKLIEAKQELSLLEQSKLKYPIGIKFKSAASGKIFTIKNHNVEKASDPNTIVFQTNELNQNGNFYACVHYKNQWAEIVDDFVLPEKWCIKDVKEVKEFFENYNYGNYSCRNIAYLHYPKIRDYCYFETIQKDYTEITLEQFKKYVLNEKV